MQVLGPTTHTHTHTHTHTYVHRRTGGGRQGEEPGRTRGKREEAGDGGKGHSEASICIQVNLHGLLHLA